MRDPKEEKDIVSFSRVSVQLLAKLYTAAPVHRWRTVSRFYEVLRPLEPDFL